MEEIQLKEAEKIKDDKVNQTLITNQKSMTSTSSSTEQDLDTFLLGDLEDGDVGPGKSFCQSVLCVVNFTPT